MEKFTLFLDHDCVSWYERQRNAYIAKEISSGISAVGTDQLEAEGNLSRQLEQAFQLGVAALRGQPQGQVAHVETVPDATGFSVQEDNTHGAELSGSAEATSEVHGQLSQSDGLESPHASEPSTTSA